MNAFKLRFFVYPIVAIASALASGLALADDPTREPSAVQAAWKTREAQRVEVSLLARVAPHAGEDSGSFALAQPPRIPEATRPLRMKR